MRKPTKAECVEALLLLGALNDSIRRYGSESPEADDVRQQLCQLPDDALADGWKMIPARTQPEE